ncbi:MAG: LemA family protein, partial [Myxococcales bacterium]
AFTRTSACSMAWSAAALAWTSSLLAAAADQAMEQALVRVNAVAEAYPDLKANQNYQELMRQLADTENQISFARQYYNDAAATLNTLVATIPWMFFTGIAGVSKREFYEAPAGQEIPPRVDFGQGGGTGAPAVEPTAPAAPPIEQSSPTELPAAEQPPTQQPPTA